MYIDCIVLHISHSKYILLICWDPTQMQFCVCNQNLASVW